MNVVPKQSKIGKYLITKKLADFLHGKDISLLPQEYMEDLGKKLYVKITEVIQAEIENVTEEDCVQYIYNLLINRTYEGYFTEIKTIYGLLQRNLGVEIKPAPDEWDRLYNIDFYVKVGEAYIGLQIKPITYEQTPEIFRWKAWLGKTHEKFKKNNGGRVFVVFSVKKGNKKEIHNPEVIDELRREIQTLMEKKL